MKHQLEESEEDEQRPSIYSLRKRRRRDLREISSGDDEELSSRSRSRRSRSLRRRTLRNSMTPTRQQRRHTSNDDHQRRYTLRSREKSTRHFFTYSSFGATEDEFETSQHVMEEEQDVEERYQRETHPKPRTTRNSLRAAASLEPAEDEDEEEEEEEEEQHEDKGRRYSLRNRTQPKRLEAETGRKLASDPFLEYAKRISKQSRAERRNRDSDRKPRRRHRRRHFDSSSESSDDGGGGNRSEETGFYHAERRRRKRELNSICPVNGTAQPRELAKADATPLEIDRSITWDSIGGMDEHKAALKEMVMLPLMYPEFFEKYSIAPPCGVLFYGPPGCGKTLVARALANSCTSPDGTGQHVTFFMRKGADCLSKWVGEAERQLRLLFEQAKRCQPSIIFFDEIDGLAPVRSTKQDQIHSSIVSTLLALMDGLDSRGQVVVIGATNRVDAIDPALRRPGRFDRELPFTLPSVNDRRKILDIHTSKWNPPLRPEFKTQLAERTVGYCGADLKALCAEAALKALRRRYPQIYGSQQKLIINVDSVRVLGVDFDNSMKSITPASHRSAITCALPIPKQLQSLLSHRVDEMYTILQRQMPTINKTNDTETYVEEEQETIQVYGIINRDQCDICHGVGQLICCDFCPSAFHLACLTTVGATLPDMTSDQNWACEDCQGKSPIEQPENKIRRFEALSTRMTYHPRLLIHGKQGMGQTQLSAALLYRLEELIVFSLDLPQLIAEPTASSAEEALVCRIREAKRSVPCVLYLPQIDLWWENVSTTMQTTLRMLLGSLPANLPLLFLATSNVEKQELPQDVEDLFYATQHQYSVNAPTTPEREALFATLKEVCLTPPPKVCNKQRKEPEILRVAPVATKPVGPTPEDLEKERERERHYLRELRIFLDQALDFCMSQKKYAVFVKPVDEQDVPDYYAIIQEPMCLEMMNEKLMDGMYLCLEDFNQDIQLIVRNAQEYNPRSSTTRIIAHMAVNMQDNILSYAHRFRNHQGYDLFAKCREIAAKRRTKTSSHPKIKKVRGLAKDFNTEIQVAEAQGVRLSRRIRGIAAAVCEEQPETQEPDEIQEEEEEEEEKTKEPEVFNEGDQVFVASRTTPGVNKPGGAGFITYFDDENDVYNVKYILGGSEKGIEACFISKLTSDRVVNSFKTQRSNSCATEEEEKEPKTEAQMSFEYFDQHIWCHLQQDGWTKNDQDELYFPPGITLDNGIVAEDYFTNWKGVLRYVKSDRDTSIRCFGRRYVEDQEDLVEDLVEQQVGAPQVLEETTAPLEEESKEAEESKEEIECDFLIDENALDLIFDEFVRKTHDFSIDELDALQVELNQMIYPYRRVYDRSELIGKLQEKKIN